MNEFDVYVKFNILEFGAEVGEHLFLRDLVLGAKVKQLEQQRQSLLQAPEYLNQIVWTQKHFR